MMSLYEIANEYKSVLQKSIDENGELIQESFAELNKMSDMVENKCVAVASFIMNMEAEASAIEEAAKTMQTRAKRLRAKTDWLRMYLQAHMESVGLSEIATSPYFKIRLKKCPVSVEVTDITLLPECAMRTKIEHQPDKVMIKKILEEGGEISGAKLVQNIKLEIK